MQNYRIWQQAKALLQAELAHLTAVQRSDRRWHMPLAAALASGLPLLTGAYFDQLAWGLTASLGGIIFLYLPTTAMHHRMVWLMACSFGLSTCYALGLACHAYPPAIIVLLTLIATLVTMVCRLYSVGPPGSLFFIMVATIGAYSPVPLAALPQQLGLLTLGCLWACLIAFAYSLYILRRQSPTPAPSLSTRGPDFVVLESILIGVFVGLALALAQAFQMERPYWVPVSCLAVIQGASLRAVWVKQVHRIIGTSLGLLLAWALLSLPQDKWLIASMVMLLTVIVESLVVRHYGLAVIFITPLTMFLAESAQPGFLAPDRLMSARFLDTLLGCVVGLVGASCLHSTRLRGALSRLVRRLRPVRPSPPAP
jgi:hypothetical protein